MDCNYDVKWLVCIENMNNHQFDVLATAESEKEGLDYLDKIASAFCSIEGVSNANLLDALYLVKQTNLVDTLDGVMLADTTTRRLKWICKIDHSKQVHNLVAAPKSMII